MSQYIFLKVNEIIRETEESITIKFNKPSTSTTYKPGQFLTFIIELNGEKLRRSYSLSSSPYVDDYWAVSVKKVHGGKMSTFLVDSLKVGEVIETMVPAGIFTYEPSASNTHDLVLIGAGSGVTPLHAVVKSALTQEKNSKVYFLLANRNENSVLLKNSLDALQKEYPSRFIIHHIYSQPLQSNHTSMGRLDKYKIQSLLEGFSGLNKTNALYYVCGPQGMMDETFQALDRMNVSHNNVRKESFTSGTSSESTTENSVTIGGSAVVVDIRYNKQTYKVNVAPGQTILEAALDQDIDLPYSCQSGMCTACMGRCKNGQVKMDDPDGLSDNEIKQGFVLTCVGRPLTADVVIEID